MLLKQLRETLENNRLPDAERSLQLQQEIISLYKQIAPHHASTVAFEQRDLVAVERYLNTKHEKNVLCELLALLRNFVPFNHELRANLRGSSFDETLANLVFEHPLTEDSDHQTVTLYNRYLQYVANFVASDATASHLFFNRLILSATQPLKHVLDCTHEKVIAVAYSALWRMLQDDSVWITFLELPDFVELTEAMIRETLCSSNSDAFELLKKVVTSPRLFPQHFDDFGFQSQSFLLDLASEQLTEAHSGAPGMTLPEETLQFCITRVKGHIDNLRKQSDRGQGGPSDLLFVKLITLLALSSLDESRGTITKDLELLIMSLECLRTVHALGKRDAEGFEQKTDFDSLAGKKAEIFESPSFGLKKDLVRLLANMCFKNKLNQDTVRDFNGIELLCDMSSLDARNPFITQWVVLALRNLMDGNEENQRIVASLTKRTNST